MRTRVSHVNRLVAAVLGLGWASAGAAALFFAYIFDRWLLVAPGLFAAWYAVLWLRVAIQARLLTWREAAMPWRAR